MPDAYGNIKGIAVPAAAWERIFGQPEKPAPPPPPPTCPCRKPPRRYSLIGGVSENFHPEDH